MKSLRRSTSRLMASLFRYRAQTAKKWYAVFCFQLCVLAFGYAQVIPKGMNYQAVARNPKGELLSHQKIGLKISLVAMDQGQKITHYSETHEVATNALGLFNLVVGEGRKAGGEFGLIPWNAQNIWLEVSIRDPKDSEFVLLSSSKLQFVPYAIHAGLAGGLAGPGNLQQSSNSSAPEPGVESTTWSVFGNHNTDFAGNPYHINALGTTDFVDLILITDNIERMRITAAGNIITKLNFDITKNLKVGQNLTVDLTASVGDSLVVKGNVILNQVSGFTLVKGPFTVENQSPSLLTGTLTVDRSVDLKETLNVDGNTDLNARMFVNNRSPSLLTGTLQVDSVSNLNDALTVTNASPTTLTGTLRTDSCATFNDRLKIDSQFSTDTSGISPSGSLQVGGGTYVKENLYVGGVAKFGGPVAFAGAVTIQDQTQSTSPSTGALKVSGGVGIGLNLNVGEAAMIGGMTSVTDVTESTDTLTGALKVFGGAGIRRRLNVGGAVSLFDSLTVSGLTTMGNALQVTSGSPYIAHFINTSNQNGISIKLANPSPGWSNNFIEFRNSNSGVVGRIEGQNQSEYLNNPNYIRELDIYKTDLKFAEATVITASYFLVGAAAGVVAAAASSTPCAGLGVCGTTPIVSLIVKAAAELAARSIGLARAVELRDHFQERKDEFVNYHAARIGVTYESGAGDYAEWLPKRDTQETFLPGYIVSLQYGQITKRTEGYGKLLVISTKPAVLGNSPEPSLKRNYEKVAFMGQVPVLVMGKVRSGDYILPSGNQDGLGRAVPVENMQAEDYIQIVGTAWSDKETESCGLVNVAIGLNDYDISKLAEDNHGQIQELKSELDQTHSILARLVPGFQPATRSREAAGQAVNVQNPLAGELWFKEASTGRTDFSQVSRDQVEGYLMMAEKSLRDNGGVPENYAFWRQYQTDPSFKENCIASIQGIYKQSVRLQTERIKQNK